MYIVSSISIFISTHSTRNGNLNRDYSLANVSTVGATDLFIVLILF
jgi:hypothetical protein